MMRLASRLRDRLRRLWVPRRGWYECTRLGLRWRLQVEHYIDREIAVAGAFEAPTTRIFRALLRPGMHVLDVGANLGWFTLLAARAVGPEGRVLACEPMRHFRDKLAWHLRANRCEERVEVLAVALSDREATAELSGDEVTATFHQVDGALAPRRELVTLTTIDRLLDGREARRVALVKIDVDGHEPAVLRGGAGFLRRCQPLLVIEFAQHRLALAGSGALALREQLAGLGYVLYSERTGRPFADDAGFLAECASLAFSANAWAVPTHLAGAPLADIAWRPPAEDAA